MYLSGGTINIITLSSLSIAIGMVVDDSIVVLENITKKLEKGGFARESAIYGTSEVSLAVYSIHINNCGRFPSFNYVRRNNRYSFQTAGLGGYYFCYYLSNCILDPCTNAIY